MAYRSEEVSLNLFDRLDDNSKNLEDCSVIWLDRNTMNHCHRRAKTLRSIVNYLKIFTNVDDCMGYISSSATKTEHIFIIASGKLGQYIVPLVHSFTHIHSIYVFCFKEEKHRLWAEKYAKIRGIFTDEQLLYEKLHYDVNLCLSQIPMNIIVQEKTSQSVQEKGTFLWSQLLLEVLLRLPPSEKSRQDMIEMSYIQYQGNPEVVNRIDEFKRTYSSDNAIYWYTLDSFVYRLVNKALRTEDIDQIFAYRFFISDLYKQLERLHCDYITNLNSPITVYRTQLMSTVELNKIKLNINEYISINTFFSTSTSSNVATDFFAGATSHRPIAEWVLIEITIDPQVLTDKPFAAIAQWSVNKDENEILFPMGTIFQIESCEQFNDNFWLIQLKLSIENDKNIKELFTYYKNQIGESSSLMILGDFLHKLLQFDKAERYYQLLLNELPEDYHADRGMALNNIGIIYTDRRKNDEALKYFYKALDIYSKNLRPVHLNVADVYNNLASAYADIDKHKIALKYQHKALRIQKKLLTPNDLALAVTYNNMADIYSEISNCNKAMHYFQKTLNIQLEKLPMNHPDLAATYYNLGCIYTTLNEYSQAYECLQKALQIRSMSLPPTHSELADTYYAIGSLNDGMGNTIDALENYHKALDIHFASKLNLDHERLTQIYSDIGRLLANQGYDIAAMKQFKKALHHCCQQDHPNIYTLVKVYNHLCLTYIYQGKYKTAIKKCCQAINLQHQCQLPDNIVFIDTYSRLANICCSRKQYNKALRFYKYVAYRYRQSSPVNQDSLAETYKNLGYVYQKKKYINKSLFYFKKALRLRLKYDPRNYNELGLIYHLIGELFYEISKRTRRVIWYYKQALDHYLRANALKTTCLANVYLSLGKIFYVTEDFIRAKRYLIKARNYIQNNNSKERLILGKTYNFLGLIHRDMNQFATARKNFKKALHIFMEQNNSNGSLSETIDNDEIIKIYNDIADSFIRELNPPMAILYLKKTLYFVSTVTTDDVDEKERVQIQIAITHLCMGYAYKEKKKFQTAGKHLKRTFNILNKNSNADCFHLGLACLYMAYIWRMKNKIIKALPFLKRAQRSFLRTNKKNKDDPLSETYFLFGVYYHYQKKWSKAKYYYELARDLRIQSPSIEYVAEIDDTIDYNLHQLQQLFINTNQNTINSV